MAALTLQSVEDAITRITGGAQKVTLPNGVSYERAQLSVLMELRKTLQSEESIATNDGGMFVPIGFERGYGVGSG